MLIVPFGWGNVYDDVVDILRKSHPDFHLGILTSDEIAPIKLQHQLADAYYVKV